MFGHDLDDYDGLYADKLGLLLAINDSPAVSWESPFRPPLKDALVVPRPEAPIPIWLGTGGNPGSTIRAGQAGLPVSYGILSGTPEHWGQMGTLYREAAAANYSPVGMVFAGHPEEIAERIIDLHHHLGHSRHFLQMDIGGMPHAEVLKSIELLGTEVAPRVRAELQE